MALKYKWVAYCHDWAYDWRSGLYESEIECYNAMRDEALSKIKWNTNLDEDFADGTTTIGYRLWFEPNMIVHASYSGTYVYLLLTENQPDSYYDVFSRERVAHLQSLGLLDAFNVDTIEFYRKNFEENQRKYEREEFCKDIDKKILEVEKYLELKEKVEKYWEYLEKNLGEPMWPTDENWNTYEGCGRLLSVLKSINGESSYLQNYGDWTADGERDTEDYMREDGKTWGEIWRENLEWFSKYSTKKK